jgi:hypothetical protein
MVGEIISEWWATSNRNGGRDHSGMVGDIERNQHFAHVTLLWSPGNGAGVPNITSRFSRLKSPI